MPIEGRTERECLGRFLDHLRPLVAAILGPQHHIGIRRRRGVLSFGFSQTTVPIETDFGRLYLYLAQELEAIEQGDHDFRLETARYWYRILEDPDPKAQAVVRWEYDNGTSADHYARHHMQIGTKTPPPVEFDLNRLHVPTGWVLIEAVLRFLVKDLGLEAACGDDWPRVLAEGEKRFMEEFRTGAYLPYPGLDEY